MYNVCIYICTMCVNIYIWYMIHDIWYVVYDIWYLIYDVSDASDVSDVCICVLHIYIHIYKWYIKYTCFKCFRSGQLTRRCLDLTRSRLPPSWPARPEWNGKMLGNRNQKIGVPLNHPLWIGIFHYKQSILGTTILANPQMIISIRWRSQQPWQPGSQASFV